MQAPIVFKSKNALVEEAFGVCENVLHNISFNQIISFQHINFMLVWWKRFQIYCLLQIHRSLGEGPALEEAGGTESRSHKPAWSSPPLGIFCLIPRPELLCAGTENKSVLQFLIPSAIRALKAGKRSSRRDVNHSSTPAWIVAFECYWFCWSVLSCHWHVDVWLLLLMWTH